ncbi:MAG: PorV/PorQ family protein [Candidatus Cloacimonas sp.]|nr:PorV/PorQ family protein [Candidatus Cloacimonas sp.]
MKTTIKNTPSRMVRFYIIGLLMMLVLPLLAEEINNSAAAYIRMGIGARIIAMGEAGAATANDITAAYWNPAGLTNMKDIEFSSMYNMNMGLDRKYQYAAIGKRFGFGVLAVNWINASVDDITEADASGNATGSFSDSEHNIAISYANSYKKMSYGFTPKLYLSSINGEMKSGFGLDLGARYDINQYIESGIMIRDLYGKVADDRIPYQIQAGVTAYPFIGVTLAADLVWEQAESPGIAFGGEYWTSIGRDPEADSQLSVINVQEKNTWADIFSNFQTGVRVGFDTESRFSAGAGMKFRNIQLDYVYRLGNNDIFNDDHIISLILRF